MGIHNRDYYRDSSGSWGMGGGGSNPVIKWLLIVNIAVFVLQLVGTRPPTREEFAEVFGQERINQLSDAELEGIRARAPRVSVIQEWFEMDPQRAVFRGQVWRFLTYAFCHDRGSLWHIVFNMLFLYWFGTALESMYGSREFLWIYLSGALAASVCFVGLGFLTDRWNPMIGASGAVMAVMVLYAFHYPRRQILLFFVIPVEIRWLVIAYVVFDLFPVLRQLGGDGDSDGVAHAAHLGGAALGLLYYKRQWRIDPLLSRFRFDRWKSPLKSKPKVRIYNPEPDAGPPADLDDRVDAVLEKISRSGEASLTDEERRILTAASEKYKRK